MPQFLSADLIILAQNTDAFFMLEKVIHPFLFFLILLTACNSDLKISMGNNTQTTTSIRSSWLTQLGATTKAFPGSDTSLYDWCSSVATDSSGNVYCAGYTHGALGETNGGSADAFVMKLNANGDLQWVRQLGADTEANSPLINDTSGFDTCESMTVDGAGNVYCAGYTSSALGETFGGFYDAFVLKLNSSGVIQWIRQIGEVTEASSALILDTSGSDICRGVSVDNTGNVYCAGSTSGSLAETNGGESDAFVMKLDPNGDIQWIRQVGADTETSSVLVNDTSIMDSCNSVAVDTTGNVYCAGGTKGGLGEANGGGINQDAYDAFVMKLDSSGNVTWLSHFGSVTAAASPAIINVALQDYFDGVAVDSVGNVYAAGLTASSFGETNGGGADVLIVKLDSAGAITWVSQIGSDTEASSAVVINTGSWETCNGIALDSSNNVYCTGDSGSSFGETVGQWSWDPIVLKMDSSGTVQWIKQLGSVTYPSPDYYGGAGYGVAVDATGTVYFSGEIYGEASEPKGGGQNGDVFIAKIRADGTLDTL